MTIIGYILLIGAFAAMWLTYKWKGCIALLATYVAYYATLEYGAPWMKGAFIALFIIGAVLFLLCHYFNYGWCRTVGPWLAAKVGGAFRWVRGQTWKLFVFCSTWLLRTVFITFWKWTMLIALGAATYYFWGKFSWMTWAVVWFIASLIFKPVRDLYKGIIVGILGGIASWVWRTYLKIPFGWRLLWTVTAAVCGYWLVVLTQQYWVVYQGPRNPVAWVTGFWHYLGSFYYHIPLLVFTFGLVVAFLLMAFLKPSPVRTTRRARA